MMGCKESSQVKHDFLVNRTTAASEITQATGSDNDALAMLMINQVLQACQDKNYDQTELTKAVIELLTELKPKNALEGMLVSMMVSSSLNSMRLMKQALAGNQKQPDATTLNLAIKLQKLFLDQVEALEKLRGKRGHQKMTVEHVHVHKGGQAVIGQVRHEGHKPGGDT